MLLFRNAYMFLFRNAYLLLFRTLICCFSATLHPSPSARPRKRKASQTSSQKKGNHIGDKEKKMSKDQVLSGNAAVVTVSVHACLQA